MSSLSTQYHRILNQISLAANKRPLNHPNPPIQLIAVSKTQSIDKIEELYQLGQRDFGENYVQELIEKARQLRDKGYSEIRWHFIGHLQTNKVRTLLPWIFCLHTLDSEKLALELAKEWRQLKTNEPLPVFLQVNLDREKTKSGIEPLFLNEFARKVAQMIELKLLGLMCVPPANLDPLPRFKELSKLEAQLKPLTRGFLSMGMSNDFEFAIREGSSHVRLGTALFGQRKNVPS